jgi:hypothetical protein
VARAALHVMKQVDADARAETIAGAADLIPPRTAEQVESVVAVGSCVLDLLTQEEPADVHTATAVLALAGPGDLAAVASVAAKADVATRQMILEAWNDRAEKAALDEMIRHREEQS